MKVQRMQPPVASQIDGNALLTGVLGLFGRRIGIERLRRDCREYFGVSHAFLVSSGKAALTVSLRALTRLRPGLSEVVIPAYTCFSVPSAIVAAGLKPVICDVGRESLDYDFDELSDRVSERTLCVVCGHLFGIPSNFAAIERICSRFGVPVLDDAAQAMGVEVDGHKLGTLGAVGIFSLGRGKCISAGSGGVIVTRSAEIGGEVKSICGMLPVPSFARDLASLAKVFAQVLLGRPSMYWLPAGLPWLRLGETVFDESFEIEGMSNSAASLMTDWPSRLDRMNVSRVAAGRIYLSELGSYALAKLEIPYLRFPILTESPAHYRRIVSDSRAMALGIRPMYPTPVSEIRQLSGLLSRRSYPNARDVCSRLLTLPTHSFLSRSEQARVCRLVLGS